MNWWHGSSPPMKDCRNGRQPPNLDANILCRALGPVSHRQRNSSLMAPAALPISDVLIVADCWLAQPNVEPVILRAIAMAAEVADADHGEAELAVMLTD